MVGAEVRDEDISRGINGDPIDSDDGLSRHLHHRGNPRRGDFHYSFVSPVGDVKVAEGVHS
jgi:hypothetical protein